MTRYYWEFDNFLETGILTPEIQGKLQETIQRLGLSRSQAALQLGVTLPTLSKWLSGYTKHCSYASRRRLSYFLQDDVYAVPSSVVAEEPVHYNASTSSARLRKNLNNVYGILRACSLFPECRDRFLRQVLLDEEQLQNDLLKKGKL